MFIFPDSEYESAEELFEDSGKFQEEKAGSGASVESPVVPAVESPVVPAVESPVVPAIESPIVPAVESPVVPAVESPVVPAVESPVVPAVASPVVPAVESPVVPAVESPVVPAVESPVVPAVESPVVSVEDSSSDSPTVSTDDSVATPTVDPSTVDPPTVDPPTVDPPTVDPSTVDPPTVDPSTVDPPTVDPPTVDPPTVDPSTVDPPTVDPPTVDSSIAPPLLPPSLVTCQFDSLEDDIDFEKCEQELLKLEETLEKRGGQSETLSLATQDLKLTEELARSQELALSQELLLSQNTTQSSQDLLKLDNSTCTSNNFAGINTEFNVISTSECVESSKTELSASKGEPLVDDSKSTPIDELQAKSDKPGESTIENTEINVTSAIECVDSSKLSASKVEPLIDNSKSTPIDELEVKSTTSDVIEVAPNLKNSSSDLVPESDVPSDPILSVNSVTSSDKLPEVSEISLETDSSSAFNTTFPAEDIPIVPKKSYNLDFLDNLDDPNFNPFSSKSAVANTPPPSPPPGAKLPPLKPAIKKKQIKSTPPSSTSSAPNLEKSSAKSESTDNISEKINTEGSLENSDHGNKSQSSQKASALVVKLDGDLTDTVDSPPKRLAKKPVLKSRAPVKKNPTSKVSSDKPKGQPVAADSNPVSNLSSKPVDSSDSIPIKNNNQEEEEVIIPSKGYNLDFLDNLDDPNFNPFASKTAVSNSPPKDASLGSSKKVSKSVPKQETGCIERQKTETKKETNESPKPSEKPVVSEKTNSPIAKQEIKPEASLGSSKKVSQSVPKQETGSIERQKTETKKETEESPKPSEKPVVSEKTNSPIAKQEIKPEASKFVQKTEPRKSDPEVQTAGTAVLFSQEPSLPRVKQGGVSLKRNPSFGGISVSLLESAEFDQLLGKEASLVVEEISNLSLGESTHFSSEHQGIFQKVSEENFSDCADHFDDPAVMSSCRTRRSLNLEGSHESGDPFRPSSKISRSPPPIGARRPVSVGGAADPFVPNRTLRRDDDDDVVSQRIFLLVVYPPCSLSPFFR